jgi:hypothetical protein
LQELYDHYHDRAAFLLVVVSEWGEGVEGNEFLLEPGDANARRRNIATVMNREHLTIPAAIDSPEANAEKSYKASPYRIVAVNRDGLLVLDARFDPSQRGVNVEQVRDWLEAQPSDHDSWGLDFLPH